MYSQTDDGRPLSTGVICELTGVICELTRVNRCQSSRCQCRGLLSAACERVLYAVVVPGTIHIQGYETQKLFASDSDFVISSAPTSPGGQPPSFSPLCPHKLRRRFRLW